MAIGLWRVCSWYTAFIRYINIWVEVFGIWVSRCTRSTPYREVVLLQEPWDHRPLVSIACLVMSFHLLRSWAKLISSCSPVLHQRWYVSIGWFLGSRPVLQLMHRWHLVNKAECVCCLRLFGHVHACTAAPHRALWFTSRHGHVHKRRSSVNYGRASHFCPKMYVWKIISTARTLHDFCPKNIFLPSLGVGARALPAPRFLRLWSRYWKRPPGRLSAASQSGQQDVV